MRKDYTVGLSMTEHRRLDDPDQKFYENYVCGAERNYTGYCDPEIDRLVDAAIDGGRIPRNAASWFGRSSAGWPRTSPGRCMLLLARREPAGSPRVKGLTMIVNSLFNGWRMEDVWLDK